MKSSIVDEAQQRFDRYVSGREETAIHPNLRSAIFRIAITAGGSPSYEAVKREYLSTTSVDGKEIALQAMGRVQTADLARDYLDFLFEKVAVQDLHSGALSLAANSNTRSALWEYIKVRAPLPTNSLPQFHTGMHPQSRLAA